MNKTCTKRKFNGFLKSKLFLISKLTFILVLVNIFTLSAKSYSQEKLLSFNMKDVTIQQVLNEITNQSEYTFAWSSQFVNLNKKVNIQVKNQKVTTILNQLFKNSGITYKVEGNKIILTPEKTPQNKQQQEKEIIIHGTVKSMSGESLPGVNIMVKGTGQGTTTDINGKYSLKVTPESELIFSIIGYKSITVVVKQQKLINVIMEPAVTGLNEVVVIGYSSRKKATITSAVSTVDISAMEKTRVSNISQAIQGQVAGVQVTSSTGAPGDPIQVRIRGEGTIGNNNPLYIVDGNPTRDINFLNPSDIKSMTVLKDAAAAAIYGSRASNGVILITTKTGTKGKTSLSLNYYSGLLQVAHLPNMMNATQYMNTLETAWNNSDRSGTNPYTTDKNRPDLANTNWLDELFELGKSQNVQLTATGGNDKSQFLMSLGYYGQDGIVIFNNDKYQKFNYRLNANINLTNRLKLGTNLQLAYSIQDKLSSKGDRPGIIRHALLRPPILPVYKDINDPTYSESDPFTDMPFYTKTGYDVAKARAMYEMTQNPIAIAFFTDDTRRKFITFGNVYGEYEFLKEKNLKFRTNVGIDLSFFHNKAFHPNYGDDDGGGSAIDKGLGRINRPNSLSESRGETRTITFNNTLNYNKTFQKNQNLNLMVGTEYITNYSSSIGASRARFPYSSPTFRYLDYGGSDLDVWNSGTASEWALLSYFASATYVYHNKYMVTGNFRADASSRFSSNNRWGFFPSFSAGWIISKENFMRNIEWISRLKIRGSWGKLGNQEIPNYTYLTLVSQKNGVVKINRFGNPNVKWETTTQIDIGIDLSVFNDKLIITADYFNKNTTDILLPINLPSVVGDVKPTILNAGQVRNKGVEFSLDYRNHEHKFKYNVSINLATLHNNVEKLYPTLPYIQETVSRTQPGHPLYAYYGYKMIGIYQNQAEINSYLSGTANPSVKPGDIKFQDINGDGIINSDDRTFIGSPIPDLTYGLILSASYNGFDFYAFFQGVNGVDRYNDTKKILDYDTRPFNYTTEVLNAWHGEGTSNTIPRVTFEDNGGSKISSVFVEDASYFRLKTLEVGYTFKKIKGIQNLRLYISGQNLLTVTNYTGLDPESTDLIDMGTYPLSRVFLFGVNVKF